MKEIRCHSDIIMAVALGVSGQIVGGMRGMAFPFRFWRGNAVPLAYVTAVSIGVTLNHAFSNL